MRQARALAFLVQSGRSQAQAALAWVLAASAASDVLLLGEGELARIAGLQRTNFRLPIGEDSTHRLSAARHPGGDSGMAPGLTPHHVRG